jgi:hypothetical protein
MQVAILQVAQHSSLANCTPHSPRGPQLDAGAAESGSRRRGCRQGLLQVLRGKRLQGQFRVRAGEYRLRRLKEIRNAAIDSAGNI